MRIDRKKVNAARGKILRRIPWQSEDACKRERVRDERNTFLFLSHRDRFFIQDAARRAPTISTRMSRKHSLTDGCRPTFELRNSIETIKFPNEFSTSILGSFLRSTTIKIYQTLTKHKAPPPPSLDRLPDVKASSLIEESS